MKKNLLLLTISIALLLTIIEFSLRIYGLGNPIIYEKSLLWGYSPLPNQQSKRLKNATVTINKDGLRTSKKFSNINKIIFYGDSVTYGGSYIDDREIFSDLVCQKLNATKELYSCGNAGVNAYGIRNITKRIKNYESKFPNHYIIITIIYGDFLRNFSQINSLPYFTKPMQNIFKATTELTLYCLDIIRNNVRFGYDKNSYKKNDEEFDTIEINESINELVNLYKISKKNNIPIKIIWSPSFQDFSINKIDYENNKIFNILKKEIKNDFVDMKNLLEKLGIDTNKIYYDGIHLSKFGHNIYAEIITEIIKKKN
jgi:lysophospholipase L1-like esterase